MSVNGWGLLGRLLSKHVDKAGQDLATSLANQDPMLAVEVDRDALIRQVRELSIATERARVDAEREQKEADVLKASIDADRALVPALQAKLADGSYTEERVTAFLNELDRKKAQLAVEEAEAVAATQGYTEFKRLLDELVASLEAFDREAKAAVSENRIANAQLQLEQTKEARNKAINSFSSVQTHMTALGALRKSTESAKVEAGAIRTTTDALSASTRANDDLESIRKELSGAPSNLADRLANV